MLIIVNNYMISIREAIIKPLTRSPKWIKTRKEHIKREACCQACGRTNNLEVHHIKDYSEHPELELDDDNLITLCSGGTKCHFVFGHLGNWKSINPDVVNDSTWFRVKIEQRRN
jgi:5-methylcytosine-specific restriction enzyme A